MRTVKNLIAQCATVAGILTPGELARLARKSRTSIAQLWRGESVMVQFDTLVAIADVLEIDDVGDLLVFVDNKTGEGTSTPNPGE